MTVHTCRATTRGAAFTLALALGSAVASIGCSGDAPGARDPSGPSAATTGLASLSMTPTKPTIPVGGKVQLKPVAYLSGGIITTAVFTFSSIHPEIASVDSNGVVTGVAPGGTSIRAATGGLVTSSFVTVTAPVLAAAVAVAPDTSSVEVGRSLQLSATVTDASGNVLTNRQVTWTSTSPAVATVDSTGRLQAASVGPVAIVAAADGKTDTASVTVAPEQAVSVAVTPTSATVQPGGTQQLAATAVGASGAILSGRPTTWTSHAPAVATVSSSGLVSAVAPGSADIDVTIDGLSATAQVTVPAPPPPPPPPPAPTVGTVFVDGFESGYAAKQNNAGWSTTTGTNIAIATDVAHSGTHSMRFTFPGKVDCLDASAEQRFTLGRNMQEVWLEYYIYYPAGGEGGSASYYHRSQYNVGCSGGASTDNNKFLAVFGPKYGGETTSIICTWTTTKALSVPPAYPGDSRIQSSYSKAGMGGVMPNIANYDPFIRGAGDRGRWMQIRAHFRVADFGQSNGEVQMWKDGVLVLSNTGLSWYDSTNQANYMTQGYLQGWANSGYAQTTNIYIDDFRIIDQNPGW